MPPQTMPLPSLADVQEWLRWVITEPRGVDKALAEPENEPQPRLLSLVVEDPLHKPEERLHIYSNAYFQRILDSMGTDFPAVRRALGPEFFQWLVAEYLMKHPSRSPNLDELGEGLSDFAKTHALAKQFPYLSDLAFLEWNVLLSLYTDRLPPLDPALLTDLSLEDWMAASITLDSTVKLFKTAWAVEKLWHARDKGHPEPKAKDLDDEILRSLSFPQDDECVPVPLRLVLRDGSQSFATHQLLVYRDDDWVQVNSISHAEWYVLSKLQDQVPLGTVLQEWEENFQSVGSPILLQKWFSGWAENGIIKKIRRGGGH